MVMKKLNIMIAAGLLLCVSCIPATKFRVPGFVSEYLILENSNDISTVKCCVENGVLSLIFNPAGDTVGVDDYYYNGGKDSEYYRLSKKFNDLYYNQKVSLMDGYMPYTNCFYVVSDVVTDISIVSDDDWNGEYVSGTLLNELFSFKYYTVYPYVESRYRADNVISEVDKPLSDISNSYLKMMMYEDENKIHRLPSDWEAPAFLKLYTDKLPDNPIQSLHITLTTDEGKTLEYSVELDLH